MSIKGDISEMQQALFVKIASLWEQEFLQYGASAPTTVQGYGSDTFRLDSFCNRLSSVMKKATGVSLAKNTLKTYLTTPSVKLNISPHSIYKLQKFVGKTDDRADDEIAISKTDNIMPQPQQSLVNGSSTFRSNLFTQSLTSLIKNGIKDISIDIIGKRQSTIAKVIFEHLELYRDVKVQVRGLLFGQNSEAYAHRSYFIGKQMDYYNNQAASILTYWREISSLKNFENRLKFELKFTTSIMPSYVRIHDMIFMSFYTAGVGSQTPAVVFTKTDNKIFYDNQTHYFNLAFDDQNPFLVKDEKGQVEVIGNVSS